MIELRGLIGWSSPSFFEINAISPNFPELVIIWRIRRGEGGTIIWKSRNGFGLENGDQAYFTSSILHVDSHDGEGPVTYELSAQVDPVSSAGSTAEINGPVSFVCVPFPK